MNEVEKNINETPIPDTIEETASSILPQPLPYVVLDGPLGGKVYLIGTAHFSVQSQKEVLDLIKQVQPNRVVLELCSSRVNILKYDEETLLKEAKEMDTNKIIKLIKEVISFFICF